MSEFRRRLMKTISDIPVGCVRCEYLASTGTQYISTNKLVSDKEDLFLKFKIKDTNKNTIFGWRWGETAYNPGQCYIDNGGLAYGQSAEIRQLLKEEVEYSLLISPNKKIVLINDVSLETKYYDTTFTNAYQNGNSVYPPRLFVLNYKNNTPQNIGQVYIYEYYLVDSYGNYTQHLIPILDQKGVPCMYDVVNKQFHYNSGTGVFEYKILQQ